MTTVAMTIAGSDPSGGAGLQADLKTFHQHGVYGTSIVTLVTVQNTRSVEAVQLLEPTLVARQLDAVLTDIPPQAAKTGALGNADLIRVVAQRVAECAFPVVVDPVMISKHGAPLLDEKAAECLKTELLPHTYLLTPNLPEASQLTGIDVATVDSMIDAARAIAALGPQHVLVKGGHLDGEALDILYSDGHVHRFSETRILTQHTHGTGCVLSAAITARLALGENVLRAIAGAKQFVTEAIRTSPGLGRGLGPVNLLASRPGVARM
jgi:hydroxymethylpyrimidine/phosphomethylpyrimidine kinase